MTKLRIRGANGLSLPFAVTDSGRFKRVRAYVQLPVTPSVASLYLHNDAMIGQWTKAEFLARVQTIPAPTSIRAPVVFSQSGNEINATFTRASLLPPTNDIQLSGAPTILTLIPGASVWQSVYNFGWAPSERITVLENIRLASPLAYSWT